MSSDGLFRIPFACKKMSVCAEKTQTRPATCLVSKNYNVFERECQSSAMGSGSVSGWENTGGDDNHRQVCITSSSEQD